MKGLVRGQKGFTLIELLIVVAVLGILAAVAIPNVTSFVSSGTIGAANTELDTVKTAGLAYAADNNGTFPASSASLTSYVTGASLGTVYYFDTSTGVVAPQKKGTTTTAIAGDTVTYNTKDLHWNGTKFKK